jgi:hypothetical protein
MHFVWLFTFLSTALGPLVSKVLIGLGIGAVSYTGINLMLVQVKSFMISQLGGAGADTLALMGLAKVDVAINIVLAAVTARALLAGMSASGSITKMGSVPK